MKCTIQHDIPGRLRVHLCCGRMSLRQADVLEYYLRSQAGVQSVKVYDRTQDAVVRYTGEKKAVLHALAVFSFGKAEAMELVPEHTSRALNREFEDKLVTTVIRRGLSRLFLPVPVTSAIAVLRSVKYIKEALRALFHGQLTVAVLDGTAVAVSVIRGDYDTAGSVMFMLRLGEILEEWTHKKSVADLASAMSLHVDNVWMQVDGTEVLTKITDVQPGDRAGDFRAQHDKAHLRTVAVADDDLVSLMDEPDERRAGGGHTRALLGGRIAERVAAERNDDPCHGVTCAAARAAAA